MVRMPAYRAVITGIGSVSPFGVGGYALVAEVLKANVSAIRPLTSFPTAGLPSCLGAEIPAAYLLETEEARRWSRLSQMTPGLSPVAEAGLCDSAAPVRQDSWSGPSSGICARRKHLFRILTQGTVGVGPLLFPVR
jgi:hypothetical protein